MLTDLLSYDIIDLMAANSWSEEEIIETLQQYHETLGVYLQEKLSPYFNPSDEAAFQKLVEDPHLTEEQIIQFYQERVPNLDGKLETFMLYFKRMFLLRLYESLLTELKTEAAMHDANAKAFPEMLEEKAHYDLKIKNASYWKKILHAAQKDDWKKVKQLMSDTLG